MSRLVMAALGALLAAPALAGPFAAGGDSGFVARGFALPELGRVRVLEAGRNETGMMVDVANEYVDEGKCAAECILLDGETARLRLSWRRGLGGGFDAGIEVPLLDQDGGFLDGWIQDWHRWFGLSNGGREFTTDGQHRYRYFRDGAVVFDETAGADGIGDVSVTLGRRLGDFGAVRAMARLPTADEPLLGSDGAGGALWLELGLPVPATWEGYVAAGISQNERAGIWDGMQNARLVFGGVGLAAPVTEAVQLVLQVQARGPAFDDSTVSPLFRPAIPMTLGLRARVGRGSALEIGFQEDLSVNASPDLGLYLALRTF
jgi:hypothetical protein